MKYCFFYFGTVVPSKKVSVEKLRKDVVESALK